ATGEQAMGVVGNLARLDKGHGLLVTAPEDLQKEISDEQFDQIGLEPRYRKAIRKLTDSGNWDANAWPPTLITMKEGLLKYIKSEDKGLSQEDKYLLTRFAV